MNFFDLNRPWVAMISQTGSELYALCVKYNRSPDLLIIHQNSRLNICPELNSFIYESKILCVERLSAPTKDDYERILSKYKNALITLHGFLRIIPPEICQRYEIYNLHPGLVGRAVGNIHIFYSELKGLDPQKKVIEDSDKYPIIGCVIHKVTPILDDGAVTVSKYTINPREEVAVYRVLKNIAFNCWVDFFNNYSNIVSSPGNSPTSNPINDIIKTVEQKYPITVAEFRRLQEEDYLLFCKKQMDYGPGNISVGTTLEHEDDRRVSQCAIIFRCFDKIQRLMNLVVKNPKTVPTNESIEDSYQDLTNFGIIARIVKNEKWAK